MPEELMYLLVVAGLFVVPGVLQRFRIPGPITCVGLGAAMGMGFGLFHTDTTLPMLSTLGIVALFLFAGLDVDFAVLAKDKRPTIGYLALYALLLGVGAGTARLLGLEWRPALLLALALFTPSAGFILESIGRLSLPDEQRLAVRSFVIASELLALAVLFGVVQSGDLATFGLSTLVLVAMVAVLPFVFRGFVVAVLPFAPKSEFAFLLIVALICSYVTRHLGVYYLVGAFVVGVTAVRLRKQLPAFASDRLLIGIELFASFFIPVYFFKAGLHFEVAAFTLPAVALALGFSLLIPLRVALLAGLRRVLVGEPTKVGGRLGLALTPTLVFTIVIAEILKERYALPPYVFGALALYAVVNTTIPGALLVARPKQAPKATEPVPPAEPAPVLEVPAAAAPDEA